MQCGEFVLYIGELWSLLLAFGPCNLPFVYARLRGRVRGRERECKSNIIVFSIFFVTVSVVVVAVYVVNRSLLNLAVSPPHVTDRPSGSRLSRLRELRRQRAAAAAAAATPAAAAAAFASATQSFLLFCSF